MKPSFQNCDLLLGLSADDNLASEVEQQLFFFGDDVEPGKLCAAGEQRIVPGGFAEGAVIFGGPAPVARLGGKRVEHLIRYRSRQQEFHLLSNGGAAFTAAFDRLDQYSPDNSGVVKAARRVAASRESKLGLLKNRCFFLRNIR